MTEVARLTGTSLHRFENTFEKTYGPKDNLTLGEVTYEVVDGIGSGDITMTYAALMGGDPRRPVAIRLLRGDLPIGILEDSGFRSEADVLGVLNNAEDPTWETVSGVEKRWRRAKETSPTRLIVAGLDAGVQPNGRPYGVQEYIDLPAVELSPVDTYMDELRPLAVAEAMGRALRVCHSAGVALKDMGLLRKLNRFRVRWLPDGHGVNEMKVVDFNVSGGPGDFLQDIRSLGVLIYSIVTGEELDVEQLPPFDTLGFGVRHWGATSEGTRMFIKRLLTAGGNRTFTSIDDVLDYLAPWKSFIEALVKKADPYGAIANMRGSGHELYGLASRLALSSDVPLLEMDRRELVQMSSDAEEAARKSRYKELGIARVNINSGFYGQALESLFVARSRIDDPDVLLEADILEAVAQIGSHYNLNPRQWPIWQKLADVMNLLRRKQYGEARDALRDPGFSELESLEPFNRLEGIATAGLLSSQAEAVMMEVPPDASIQVQLLATGKALGKATEARGIAGGRGVMSLDLLEAIQRKLHEQFARYWKETTEFGLQLDADTAQASTLPRERLRELLLDVGRRRGEMTELQDVVGEDGQRRISTMLVSLEEKRGKLSDLLASAAENALLSRAAELEEQNRGLREQVQVLEAALKALSEGKS